MLELDTLLLGRYRILKQIGKGGMGTVFLAKDDNLGITVAVKQNFFTDARLIEAFKREARLLAGLRHSALPRVIDHFLDITGQYLVMEYIPGEDLGSSLERRKKEIEPIDEAKPFSVDQVVKWAEQLLDALEYLHTRPEPIIHRDVKPQNLKLAERDQIILLDFGLAKGKPLQMSRATTTGSIYGYTPTYAPIEQIKGLGTDPRSDLYALAATLYHLITGVAPVDAATRADAHLGNEPDPLRPANELNSRVPQGVSALLTRAMEQHRKNRPASAAEMAKMLRTAKRSTVVEWQNREASQTLVAETQHNEERGEAGEVSTQLAEHEPRSTRVVPVASQPEPAEIVRTVESAGGAQPEQLDPRIGELTFEKHAGDQRRTKKKLAVAAAFLLLVVLGAWGSVKMLRKPNGPPVPRAAEENVELKFGVWTTPTKIFKVSLSDDGRALASAGDEPVVRLWRPDSARELIGHTQRGRSVAMSRDGETVASGSEDGSIRLWRAKDGQLINSWRGHSFYVFAVGFSPDGQMLYSASADKTIKLWRVSDGALVKTVNRPEAGYSIVTISPDLRLAGYYREDGSFKLWSLVDDTLIRLLDGNVPMVYCGAFTRDGRLLALGSEDGAVQVWRVSDGRMERSLGKFDESVVSVTFSADGLTVAAGLEHGTIKLWRISDGNLIGAFTGHTQSVDCLAFRSDNRALASGSDDKTVRMWSLDEK